MKIGILTFHFARNYGAALQAYALREHLSKDFGECSIIDYRPPYITGKDAIFAPPKNFSPRGLAKWCAVSACRLLALGSLRARAKKFDEFLRRRIMPAGAIPPEKPDCDFIVFGSDQIWNPRLTLGGDPVYLGAVNSPAPKIGYAVSAGAYAEELLSDENRAECAKKFRRIGSREKSLSDALMKYAGIESPVVLDPTFLIGGNEYEKISKRIVGGDYLFVYELSRCREIGAIASKIARPRGWKVVRLRADYMAELPFGKLVSVSPEEFLGLIRNAKCVLTTSFHGTALSVIFRRDFYFVSMGMKNEGRITNLLKTFRLESRFAEARNFPDFEPVRWSPEIEAAISENIAASKQFLKDSLK